MATKAQLIDYIVNNFEGPDNEPASKAKLEGYKKSELEELVDAKASMEEAEEWIANN